MENEAKNIKKEISFIAPIKGRITSTFGWRNPTTSTVPKYHTGLDIAAPTGTSIFAAAGGTVVAAGYTSGYGGYGNIVVIKSTESLSIRYGHCSAVFVSVGQQVTQGQCIAAVGSTGMSTGPHLHFEIRYNGATVNPQLYLYR
jgi:murein DD-endopeptidase MepM/ murein hydrolase activator NlpD